MKAFFMLPESKSELEKMDFEQKAMLWARYSPYPYRRQVRAFAVAWRYRMVYEKHGDLEYVVKSEQTSWRSLYRYLNLAYMHPEKVNNILSGKEVCTMEEIFAIAPQHQL